MKRVAILVVSLMVAAGTLLFASPSAVHAAAPQCFPGSGDAHHRTVNICGAEPRPNHFTLKGRILPKYRHKVAILQRKACKGCHWHNIRRDRTTLRGKYAFRNVTRLGFYRVKARAGNGFRVSYSTIVRIYRIA